MKGFISALVSKRMWGEGQVSTNSLSRLSFLIVLVSILLLMSTIPDNNNGQGESETQWPMLYGNPQRTGLGKFDGSPNGVEIKWRMNDVSAFPSAVIGDDGTLYANHYYELLAIDQKGRIKWAFVDPFLSGLMDSAPAVDESAVYLGMSSGIFVSLNLNGTVRWWYEAGGPIRSSPLLDGAETVYFGSDDGYLTALYTNGTLRWRSALGSAFTYHSPALGHDGTIYVCTDDGSFWAINPDGTTKWNMEIDRNTSYAPAVMNNGDIILTSEDGVVRCFTQLGIVRWQYHVGAPIISSPSIGPDGTVIVGSMDGFVHSIAADGIENWRFLTDAPIQHAAAISKEGTIHIANENGTVYALSSDGSLVWETDIGGNPFSPVLGRDGTVYVGSLMSGFVAIGGRGLSVSTYAFVVVIFAVLLVALAAYLVSKKKAG